MYANAHTVHAIVACSNLLHCYTWSV